MSKQELEILAQEEKYRQQVNLMRQLYSAAGFFKYYFEQLPKHPTQIEAFNYVNDLHLDLFGQYRYSDYDSFRQALGYHKRKNHLR